MSHLLPFALCLAGFAALALATNRQQRNVLRRALGFGTIFGLRIASIFALLLALGMLVTWKDAGLGLVMFSGYTSLSAGIVYCALLAWAKMRTRS